MRPRTAVLVLLAVICAVLGAGIGTAAAHAATKPPWRTCKPGTKDYLGAYRVVDNAWSGPSSKRFCVTSTGLNVTIGSQAIPHGSNVVAYPNVRFGAFFTDGDPQSGLPVRVTRIGQMTLHVKSNCKASGTYLTDADIWYRPRAVWTQHGTFEMVIANCWQGFGAPGGTGVIMPDMSCLPVICGHGGHSAPARIGHVAYRATEWITRDPVTGYTWPILVFRQVHQTPARGSGCPRSCGGPASTAASRRAGGWAPSPTGLSCGRAARGSPTQCTSPGPAIP